MKMMNADRTAEIREDAACGDCVYWHKSDDQHGQCRRNPPLRGVGGALWPETNDQDWCGQYQFRDRDRE